MTNIYQSSYQPYYEPSYVYEKPLKLLSDFRNNHFWTGSDAKRKIKEIRQSKKFVSFNSADKSVYFIPDSIILKIEYEGDMCLLRYNEGESTYTSVMLVDEKTLLKTALRINKFIPCIVDEFNEWSAAYKKYYKRISKKLPEKILLYELNND